MPQRTRDAVVAEIRQSQKKLRTAKGRKDQGTVRYLQARIKHLQGEMTACDQVA